MGRVLTNNTSFTYAIESALGVPGTEWRLLEPNSVSTFGASITTVARTPISKTRQRRKGTVTDLDSTVEFEHDLTMSAFTDFIEGFCFSSAVNGDLDFSSTNVDESQDEFTISSLSAAQAAKLQFSSGELATLIHARSFDVANNGLHALNVAAAAADTVLGVESALVNETPSSKALIELAGLRLLQADTDVVFAYSAGLLTITEQSEITGFDWASFGLTPGQLIFVGSPDANGDVQNALEDSSANDTYGYARIKTISAQVLTLDKVDAGLQVTSPTSAATVDILFGKFLRNVSVDSPEYLERSFQFEAEFPNLGDAGADKYQYAEGNYCNSAAFSLPLTDKAVVTFGFQGTDTANPTTTRKSGASTAVEPNRTSALNTSSDIARLRITDTDETGITTDFKSLTLTLNNNVSPEKVIGKLGAAFVNTGNFEIDIETQLIFTNSEVVDKIRENATVTMDFIVKNDDGAIGIDIPSMTIGGGGREFPVNESVLISTTCQAFGDDTLGTSIGISMFPVVPQ